jgi:glucosamine-6-phosphate deaminase
VELRVFPDPAAVAVAAADIVQNAVATRPSLRFGVATGSSPMATYAELGRRGIDWTAASIWLLDEYVGLDPSDPNSYKCTIQRTLGDHLGIRPDQVHAPDTSSADLEAAARRYDAAIDAAGGIDLQILGIGRNGHIGFNEPGSSFAALTSVVDLTATTRDDNARFFASPDDVPRRAITQGIGRILRARRLLVIVTGAAKAPALAAALDGPIDEAVPASALRRHPAVTVLADVAAVARR